MPPKAVVLLSGGLDSVTCLAVAKKEKFDIHALCFDYGQRHKIEINCARRSAAKIGVEKFHLIQFDLRQWGASALTSDRLDVPEFQEYHDKVPITYVPARNLIFLSFGTALAEGIGARDIFIGVNSMDYSGYPDCRPPFIEAFRQCARLGTKAVDEHWEFNIRTPLQHLHKREIIELGLSLGVDYSLTHSCYNPNPDGRPCGHCDSCGLRNAAFAELGMIDPALTQ
ncbi:MAG: 7-cyano-7-deazaguanine synthase QueC [Lentisphaeria bacterium]|nr:7-cyano-7-deazaguanine synthase QueC [Lentisphaeria bacterium]